MGADVTADVVNATRGEIILDNVMANVSGIGNATIERTINAQLSNTYGSIQLRTIDVDSWGAAAYYEPGWFSGGNVDQMLKEMKENNNTIIIDRAVAKQLGKSLYDEVAIDFNSCARKLRIIGFFGPEPQESSVPNFVIGGSSKSNYISSQFYSYVPKDLFNMTYGSDIFTRRTVQYPNSNKT